MAKLGADRHSLLDQTHQGPETSPRPIGALPCKIEL